MELSKGVNYVITSRFRGSPSKLTYKSSFECKGRVKSSVETWVHEIQVHGIGESPSVVGNNLGV